MYIVTRKHVCDRCGNEIKNPVSDYLRTRTRLNYSKTMLLESEEAIGYFTSIPKELSCDSVNLDICYTSKKKKFELCHKCKKDFENFMIRR
jgi:protein-arginine kinase activator protein McsA